jgi:hypothetical protein
VGFWLAADPEDPWRPGYEYQVVLAITLDLRIASRRLAQQCSQEGEQ